MNHNIKPGVATGDQVQEILKLAKEKKFALPAVNVIGSSSINGVLETAKKLNSPVIIQFSNGGAGFNAPAPVLHGGGTRSPAEEQYPPARHRTSGRYPRFCLGRNGRNEAINRKQYRHDALLGNQLR